MTGDGMPKIDLITGFLGSGKTTFIRRYAEYLISGGERVGILENDLGAVNVDTMLLEDLESDDCGLEMIVGGCCREPAAHRQRFASKLIAMRMDGYDRVIVEPSGIYDVDEFFDVLRDEPLDGWYEIGNVIALADADLEEELSPEAEYILGSQLACAGKILVTRSDKAKPGQLEMVRAHLARALGSVRCGRRLSDEDIIFCELPCLTDEQLGQISCCGYLAESFEKVIFDAGHAFDSLFFMHPRVTACGINAAVRQIFADDACGHVMRIKGFLRQGDSWVQINAAPGTIDTEPINDGQEIIIVIGQGLDEERIGAYLEADGEGSFSGASSH